MGRPTPTTIPWTAGFVFGTDLGTPNATDTTHFACDTRTENSTRYHLEVSSATEQIVSDVRPFDQVTLVLAGGGMVKMKTAPTRAKSLWLARLCYTDHCAMLHSL